MFKRIFVRKKEGFRIESENLLRELRDRLNESGLSCLHLYNVYDIIGVEEDITLLKEKVLAEAVTDEVFDHIPLERLDALCIEPLPGQYDQRSDSAEQCLRLLNNRSRAQIRSSRLLVFEGAVRNREALHSYLVNPIESRIKDMSCRGIEKEETAQEVLLCTGFRSLSGSGLALFWKSWSLAISLEDLQTVQDYFKNSAQRDPTETEIRVLDAYWSDHCRHSTFETFLTEIKISSSLLKEELQSAFELYLSLRQEAGRSTPPTLMDMATLGARILKKRGLLEDLEVSEENNACSIEITVDHNGHPEPWLLMFKNETHNHPTEIEPFGGASTCIGGAIRDPLSGRAYVYQAMRITGAGDVTAPLSAALKGKLPQAKISKTAALGNSSYGNQIGVASTFVREIYHKDYEAKRLEAGAVIGAAPKAHVHRESPKAGDLVFVIGGRTGRDGIGGAAGSSKEHNEQSLERCASEVQKGNAPVERRLQRLFRNPQAARLIKKSNDFGAGGVCVALGEIARGIDIDLATLLVKYRGLSGTELALSESQERMAVVLDPAHKDRFLSLVREENLEASLSATVTSEEKLVIRQGKKILVDIDRSFLDTGGVSRSQSVDIGKSLHPSPFIPAYTETKEGLVDLLQDLNSASQRGMVEMFDASIGRGTVLMPYGGRRQLTEAEASVQKIPVEGFTRTCSLMAYGFNPCLSAYSPFLGAQYAVIESLARLAAAGADVRTARLSFQEYFERLGKDPLRWGKPCAALLGALKAQMEFSVAAIGGKDSMSGTYGDRDVPPTLISFAVAVEDMGHILSPEIKKAGSILTLLPAPRLAGDMPDYALLRENFTRVLEARGKILSAATVKAGGLAETLFKMGAGNGLGVDLLCPVPLTEMMPGALVLESNEELGFGLVLGRSTEDFIFRLNGITLDGEEAVALWEKTLGQLYPYHSGGLGSALKQDCSQKAQGYRGLKIGRPKVLIAVFPGTNCEYDCQKAFRKAGAETEIFVFNNLSARDIGQSIEGLSEKIASAQIFVIPGGFSAGDEPDGSGKFIANILQNAQVSTALQDLLAREGLVLGICNGFQALVKAGLLPYSGAEATLFRNDLGRHISRICTTRVASVKSPWLQSFTVGEVHHVALSHGEGKLVLPEHTVEDLFAKGQVAFQYCTPEGEPAMDGRHNLNGSLHGIEGLLSPCGQILGKMAHSERYEEGLFQNITGNKDQDIFANGVRFFQGELC